MPDGFDFSESAEQVPQPVGAGGLFDTRPVAVCSISMAAWMLARSSAAGERGAAPKGSKSARDVLQSEDAASKEESGRERQRLQTCLKMESREGGRGGGEREREKEIEKRRRGA